MGLAYRNGLQLRDERMDAEVALLADVLLQHLHRVELRTLIGTRVPCPSEVRGQVQGDGVGGVGVVRAPRRIPGAVTRG